MVEERERVYAIEIFSHHTREEGERESDEKERDGGGEEKIERGRAAESKEEGVVEFFHEYQQKFQKI